MRYTRETLTCVAAGMMATVMAAPVGQSHSDAMQAKDKKPPQEVREHVNQWEDIDHAVAVVRPTKGNSVKGTVWFTQTKKGVRVEAKIRGLDPQSKHAFHIHKYGDATAADATSAGGHAFRAVGGAPILRDERIAVEHRTSEAVPELFSPGHVESLRGVAGLTLFVGPGSRAIAGDRVIETGLHLGADTDVVADPHWLPFRSHSFDLYIAMNVYQHLFDPRAAAREALRVLKPGGRVLVQTGFLQPLHEAPAHYYNATEWGLRRWFDGFLDVEVEVTPNFNPLYALSWIGAQLLHAAEGLADGEAAKRLGALTLGEVAAFWDEPSKLDPELIAHFFALPQNAQRAIAAGFEMTARKPGLRQPGLRESGARGPGLGETGLREPGPREPDLRKPGVRKPG